MTIEIIRCEPIDSRHFSDFHLITYAETGFSALKMFADDAGVSHETLSEFVDQINRSDKSGSLYPDAEISAVPLQFIRSSCASLELEAHIEVLLRVNMRKIKASNLIFSFRDDVNSFVVDVCKSALKNMNDENIRNVVIYIENEL